MPTFNEDSIEALVSRRRSIHCRKNFLLGTHRANLPEDTLQALQPDLKRFGITRIARITDLDRLGIEVFTIVRPNCRGLSVTQGKGANAVSAKLSGVMEAIECWHAERPDVPLFYASYSELRDSGRKGLSVLRPPNVIASSEPLTWTTAIDLVSGAKIAVPFDLVHADFLATSSARRTGIFVSTNGLASGGNLVEALIHALCEVVERHNTVMLGSLTADGRRHHVLDLSSLADSAIGDLLGRCVDAGVKIEIWDASLAVSIPCFVACVVDMADPHAPPGFGAGCHPSREVAISRAVVEAAQSRLTRISGARDDLAPKFYGRHEGVRARYLATATDSEFSNGGRLAEDTPDIASDCLIEDLWRIVEELSASDWNQVLAISLANDPRYRVVRVIVPGMLGMDAEQ